MPPGQLPHPFSPVLRACPVTKAVAEGIGWAGWVWGVPAAVEAGCNNLQLGGASPPPPAMCLPRLTQPGLPSRPLISHQRPGRSLSVSLASFRRSPTLPHTAQTVRPPISLLRYIGAYTNRVVPFNTHAVCDFESAKRYAVPGTICFGASCSGSIKKAPAAE